MGSPLLRTERTASPACALSVTVTVPEDATRDEAYALADDVMEAAQPIIEDIPVVLMYPGIFDGRTLKLFGRLEDGNYYRAFSLL